MHARCLPNGSRFMSRLSGASVPQSNTAALSPLSGRGGTVCCAQVSSRLADTECRLSECQKELRAQQERLQEAEAELLAARAGEQEARAAEREARAGLEDLEARTSSRANMLAQQVRRKGKSGVADKG